MKIYFSGIGGVGIGPLAEIAHASGYFVDGSDINKSLITAGLDELGVKYNIGYQDGSYLEKSHGISLVDLFVYTAALPKDHPELLKAKSLGIKTVKRDELLNIILKQKNLKLIAVAGTHGKTGTTAMMVWALQQLGVPVSYSIGSTMKFGKSGSYQPQSEYFIYECDEFDRNFLNFEPHLSLITSIGYDHPDTYPNEEEYLKAFRQFVTQSDWTIAWNDQPVVVYKGQDRVELLDSKNGPDSELTLIGEHNRRNASLILSAFKRMGINENAVAVLNSFPGVDRRFEKLAPNLYTDYGHHPVEIAATINLANELSTKIAVVYQPHQNIRQHNIVGEYLDQFEKADKIYWLPTFLSREDKTLPILKPKELTSNITNKSSIIYADLNDSLWSQIQKDLDNGYLVVGVGAGDIDAWLRSQVLQLTKK